MLAGFLVALPPPEKWVSTGIGFPPVRAKCYVKMNVIVVPVVHCKDYIFSVNLFTTYLSH
jgi:hypothetical protein